ncbi:MAG: ribonuclease III, partial [Patescibacteria group bacterium]
MKIEDLEHTVGCAFKEKGLLNEALTHRSYLNERPEWPHPHNERLEYLGDAVLELAVSESLFQKFPKAPEGELTVLRAALVNYQMLGKIAASMELGKFIFMSKSELRDTGKAREVILANAFEALVGALYLDRGFLAVKKFIETRVVEAHLEEILQTKSYKDPKSELQEIVQEKLKLTPAYKVLSEDGPAHQRTFRSGVYFGDHFAGEGAGTSKQEAETDAARKT